MRLEDFGYNDELEKFRIELNLDHFDIGRIITEHKERYTIKTATGAYEGEITGNMRFTARNREDYPAVGDWVALTTYDADSAIIHQVLPRFSVIKRQAVGQTGESQIIATNIDFALIIQAIDRDFNINRLERYLTICNSSKVEPVIILSKVDLIDESEVNEILDTLKARIKGVPVFAISNETMNGYEAIRQFMEKGKTYCSLGSSGVGKSTLLNNLSGRSMMRTDSISQTTHKGRHITSHRELIVLESGGIIIDNPGMREVGIADNSNGLEMTFDLLLQIAQNCRFKDCTHTNEMDCAVIKAVEDGELDSASFENYMKLEKEKAHYESSVEDKRKRDKEFGKMMKNYKKDIKKI